MEAEYLNLLVCPECMGVIAEEGKNKLTCTRCGKTYPVIEDIPILLKEKEAMDVFYSLFPDKQPR